MYFDKNKRIFVPNNKIDNRKKKLDADHIEKNSGPLCYTQNEQMIASKKGNKKTLEKDNRFLYPTTPSDFPISGCSSEGVIFWNQFVWLLYTKEKVIIK